MQEDPRIDGVVSLWVGIAPSREVLHEYIEVDYSTDESPHRSEFDKDCGAEYYDEDFMEADIPEKPTCLLSELLRGCSYDWIIIPKFVELCGDVLPEEANAFVLLYNFQHYGKPGSGGGKGPVRLRYLGSIKVDMPWPD